MKRFRSLTVSQTMIVIFLSGLSVGVLFASLAIRSEIADHRALVQDRALLDETRDMGAIVHELQRERRLTTAWLTSGNPALAPALAEQQLRVDDVMTRRLGIRSQGAKQRDLMPDAMPFASLSSWLRTQRDSAATGDITAEDYSANMTAKIANMTRALIHRSRDAQSVSLALLIRNSTALMTAKDALGLEGSLGLGIAAMQAQGTRPSPDRFAALGAQLVRRTTALDRFRAVADEASLVDLSLWAGAAPTLAFADLRDRMLNDLSGPGQVSVETWLRSTDLIVDRLRKVEVDANRRLYATLAGETEALRAGIWRDILYFTSLVLCFGSLALLAMRQVDVSIRKLIRTISEMSIDVTQAKVPRCPQRDLDKIADALSVLRSVQIERRRQLEAAEHIRSSVDQKLDDVLTAAAHGKMDRRIEVLGLDAHGAVLARGINQLLDQIERDKVSSA